MPHSAHRRRHRSRPRAETWLQRLALGSCVLLVGLFLGAHLARSQPGPGTWFGIVSALALVVLMGLIYGLARVAAAVRNAWAIHSAQIDLARFMRTNPSFRAARHSISRPHR